MSSYRYDVSARDLGVGTSQSWLRELAAGADSVLDVGCSTGGLALALQASGRRVLGIDTDPDAVGVAISRGVEAVVADISTSPLVDICADRRFGCVVFGDVLEHIADPGKVLAGAREVLTSEGFVLISIPNVSHGSVRLSLLLNRWDGRDTGLLDRTHLRFFTLDTIVDLAEASGYAVTRVERTSSLLEDPGQDPVSAVRGVLSESEWLRRAASYGEEAQTLQFVLRLEPRDPRASTLEAAQLSVARARVLVHDTVRENAHLRSEVEVLRKSKERAIAAQQDILRMRDHVIGLESECRELRPRAEAHDYMLGKVVEMQAVMDAMSGSIAWRLGRLLTLPLRVIRKVLRKAKSAL